MSKPFSFAHSRTLAVLTASVPARRPRGERRFVPPVLPGVSDVRGQGLAQFVTVRGAEVDLEIGAVKGEPDRAFGRAAVEVVNEAASESSGP